jgi:hypothetical protein
MRQWIWEVRARVLGSVYMRFKIEFLEDSTNVHSVCLRTFSPGPLEQAISDAQERASVAKRMRKVDGYQIRDLDEEGRIVWLERFVA